MKNRFIYFSILQRDLTFIFVKLSVISLIMKQAVGRMTDLFNTPSRNLLNFSLLQIKGETRVRPLVRV